MSEAPTPLERDDIAKLNTADEVSNALKQIMPFSTQDGDFTVLELLSGPSEISTHLDPIKLKVEAKEFGGAPICVNIVPPTDPDGDYSVNWDPMGGKLKRTNDALEFSYESGEQISLSTNDAIRFREFLDEELLNHRVQECLILNDLIRKISEIRQQELLKPKKSKEVRGFFRRVFGGKS